MSEELEVFSYIKSWGAWDVACIVPCRIVGGVMLGGSFRLSARMMRISSILLRDIFLR